MNLIRNILQTTVLAGQTTVLHMLPGLVILSAVSAIAAAAENSAVVPEQESVVVQELTAENWDSLVPQGKEVDAIYGDIVLQNRHLRAVIAKPITSRNANMTVRNIGGCLIDLTTRRHESDQLSAFFPGRRAFSFSAIELSSAAAASKLPDQKTASSSTAAITVRSEGTDSLPEYSVSWSLTEDASFMTAVSTWKNSTAADITLTLEDDLRADAGKEDMPKAADGTHELFWFHDIFWQQAYGIHAPGFRVRCNGNARESVLVYEPVDGKPIVVKPGESYSLKRYLFVNQDLPGVLADYHDCVSGNPPLPEKVLTVMEHGHPVANARVAIQCGEQSRGTVVTSVDGTASVRLPAGECRLTVTVAGQEFAPQTLAVGDQPLTVEISKYNPGIVQVSVVDERDQSIPAKIEFKGKGDTPTPNWGPETAEFFVRNLAYTANGKATAPLQAGEYEVTVSHGPEYHAEFTTLKIEHGKTVDLTVKLPRLMNTTGWVSADFHSHSSPSGDNTGSQLGRVLNLASEHLEFAPCTEHNRVSTYEHHIESLGLKSFMATVSGMELTGQPLPLNHQNAFPMIYRPRTQDGGAPSPDLSPESQMERLAAWDNNSIKLIQQNHPDIGWLFFDRNGDQTPDEGYSRSFPLINVMEIHPIDQLLNPGPLDVREGKEVGNLRALNWLQLLNQGFRIYGVVNTDSHYNYHGSGGLRMWLKSSTDEPAQISSDEMRDMARSGQIIMSNAPFLEASFRESGSDAAPVISGNDLNATSKKVSAAIKVQCANWFDIDTVMVLVNGRRTDSLTFTRDSHPDLFSKDTVRFQHSLEVELKADAHLIVLTGHRTQLLGDVVGPMWGTQHPTALTNPVFVDVAGDGFTANKDTLDLPLPVKYQAPKK
jgi:hypothetical protein